MPAHRRVSRPLMTSRWVTPRPTTPGRTTGIMAGTMRRTGSGVPAMARREASHRTVVGRRVIDEATPPKPLPSLATARRRRPSRGKARRTTARGTTSRSGRRRAMAGMTVSSRSRSGSVIRSSRPRRVNLRRATSRGRPKAGSRTMAATGSLAISRDRGSSRAVRKVPARSHRVATAPDSRATGRVPSGTAVAMPASSVETTRARMDRAGTARGDQTARVARNGKAVPGRGTAIRQVSRATVAVTAVATAVGRGRNAVVARRPRRRPWRPTAPMTARPWSESCTIVRSRGLARRTTPPPRAVKGKMRRSLPPPHPPARARMASRAARKVARRATAVRLAAGRRVRPEPGATAVRKRIRAEQPVRARLVKARLARARLARARLVKARLVKARLVKARLVKARLVKARLVRARLVRARLVRARLVRARLVRARLVRARLVRARLVR
ncbi:MAG: pentapeptide repeat-containing protein, partial [Planctomycetaceae bacterium]